LRASFVRPVPGTKLSEWDGKMEDLPETLVEGYDEAKTDEEKKQLDQGEFRRSPPRFAQSVLTHACLN